MKLTGISFIGVDEYTDLVKLSSMCSNSVIPIEIGILFSPNRAGKQDRYPSLEFIKDFAYELDNAYIKFLDTTKEKNIMYHSAKLSLHLCGDGVRKFLQNDVDYLNIAANYDRVQLNFSISEYDSQDLIKKISNVEYSGNIVLQENKSKHEFNKNFYGMKGIDFLFDGSGGFGRVLEKPLQPIQNHYCGYAGGIGPDTVEEILNKIYKLNKNDTRFYLDMESKIRENNKFSIEKCQKVIDICTRVKEYHEGDFK